MTTLQELNGYRNGIAYARGLARNRGARTLLADARRVGNGELPTEAYGRAYIAGMLDATLHIVTSERGWI